jgi:hypothetical protein
MRWQWRLSGKVTSAQHNKWLGIAHLAYAGVQLIAIAVLLVLLWSFPSDSLNELDMPPIFQAIMILAILIAAVLAIPIVVAAYAFLKRRPWAKTAGIVGGVIAGMNFPLGTVLGIYTFWFLLSDAGKEV